MRAFVCFVAALSLSTLTPSLVYCARHQGRVHVQALAPPSSSSLAPPIGLLITTPGQAKALRSQQTIQLLFTVSVFVQIKSRTHIRTPRTGRCSTFSSLPPPRKSTELEKLGSRN